LILRGHRVGVDGEAIDRGGAPASSLMRRLGDVKRLVSALSLLLGEA